MFEKIIKPYFKVDFVSGITDNYFSNNNLLIIIISFPDGIVLKNEKLVKNKNNIYNFNVEEWYPGKPSWLRTRCLHDRIYIFQIGIK
jgi:hypothetical protein